ncbi:hypothetical protein [Quadrisphaera sp. INWT6]|uniref:hypothetical protein n=1 Tax=Quadrisphaera sp. INWT6 TaxID=2596917 RepID=UPI001892102C|nr:hypothetical protein [Quadrisphaera sp. INWT6]MBF5083489.1 hypothetical protein [Quadrisphaera sp. INWT6]
MVEVSTSSGAPGLLPVLSAGRHRSPRRGACFMEMASYLAGERWSDHPACTHPLLASAARAVNDATSDTARSRLALLVPSVVGLTSSDPHLGPRLVRAAAQHALPVVALERQHVLAAGVLTCDRVLAALDGRDPARLEEATCAALAPAPGARRWAEGFARDLVPDGVVRRRTFEREAAPRLLHLAATGIAAAVVPDADERLHALLAELVSVARAHAEAPSSEGAVGGARWDDVVGMTAAR